MELKKLLNSQIALSWLCARDFNEILYDHEKKAGNLYRARDLLNFYGAISDCNLLDAGFVGYKYTWTNGRRGGDNTQERG